jgi:hypothetical protein
MRSIVAALGLWLGGMQCGQAATVISSAQRVDQPNVEEWLWPGGLGIGFGVGGPVWKDYTFFITSRPAYLADADRVLLSYTASQDTDFNLKLTLAVPAQLFILIDDRVPDISAGMPWVGALGFTDTGDDVIVSEGGPLRSLSVYRAEVPSGDVTFLHQPSPAPMIGMYGIAALPQVPEPSAGVLALIGTATLFARWRSLGWRKVPGRNAPFFH